MLRFTPTERFTDRFHSGEQALTGEVWRLRIDGADLPGLSSPVNS